ncbi:hypothetical protein HIM_06139 [Hirsutella minnesotensis 3608]|uniref:Uncharacterized protein n=1 Tax=Hirsutella minnesotensis 3608 TaxID=1043627 RepID=A0A0F7ZUA9_9HYPO|nr:hypothetical protein HIM_06139 [Hirsutella minnesotensis 3608]
MDPFEALPCEVRRMILQSAGTWEDAVRLSHASPALLQTRLDYSASIQSLCRYKEVHNMFPSDLLQDALAIVTAPPRESKDKYRKRMEEFPCFHCLYDTGDDEDKPPQCKHVDKWAAKDFVYPLEDTNFALFGKLQCLYRRLKRYMDDYITKATSTDPVFAYSHVPQWSHSSFCNRTPFFTDQLDAARLSPAEQYRLLKAFLRFELYSVFSSSRLWNDLEAWDDWTERSVQNEKCGTKASCMPCKWRWSLPNRYYEQTILSEQDREGLCCVMEYTRLLYAAIQAQPTALRSCSSSHHSADGFAMDSRSREFIINCGLGLGGFRQLDRVLSGEQHPPLCWLDDANFLKYWDMDVMKPKKDTLPDGSGLWLWLNIEDPWSRGHWEHTELASRDGERVECRIICAYRQRAWAFFDDERLYPESYEFPTVEGAFRSLDKKVKRSSQLRLQKDLYVVGVEGT